MGLAVTPRGPAFRGEPLAEMMLVSMETRWKVERVVRLERVRRERSVINIFTLTVPERGVGEGFTGCRLESRWCFPSPSPRVHSKSNRRTHVSLLFFVSVAHVP